MNPCPQPCPVQELFDRAQKFLHGRVLKNAVEEIHLLPENFPYWIKLENPNPADLSEWIPAKANIVVPMLQNGTFDQTGFRIDQTRVDALFNIPELLQTPNCIHRNLRNHECRGHGGIKGDLMYVKYYGKKKRKVGFTLFDPKLGMVILSSSFWTYKDWVQDCAHMPAIYVKQSCKCTCK